MAKIKQIFKVKKLNLQYKVSIKSLLHLIKLNNKYTYCYYLFIENIITVKKNRIFITFHNKTCWFRHVGLKSAPPKQKSNMHTEDVTEVMHIWLKTSERHKAYPRVMKERINENHPWVTDNATHNSYSYIKGFNVICWDVLWKDSSWEK